MLSLGISYLIQNNPSHELTWSFGGIVCLSYGGIFDQFVPKDIPCDVCHVVYYKEKCFHFSYLKHVSY